MKKVLLTATVQSHICQFHKPLVALLHENGYEVHVAARDNLAEKNGMKLDFVDKIYNVNFARSPFSKNNITAYKQMKKILSENSYDVIHCNTPMGGIITRLAADKYRKNGTKVFYTAHGFHFYDGAPKKNWIIYYPIEKAMAKRTDKLVTITSEDYRLASEKFKTDTYHIHGVGVNSSKYRIFSSEECEQVRKELGYDSDVPIILCVGELLPNKNQKTIITAMNKIVERFPKCKLVLAGNGSEDSALKTLTAQLGLESNVDFIGYCLTLQKYENICSVAVSCSYREGLPLNIMEAMLCKKPVVASINRGHKELVSDGKTGYLVNPDDSNAFAQKVIDLLDNDKLCSELGENAYKDVQKFTDTSVTEELRKLYELD